MNTFAFIIHPIDPKRDVSRKFPLAGRIFNERQINFLSTFFPPVYISEIDGITSIATGESIQGWFIACPYTPSRMMELPVKTVYRKIIQAGRLAERLGAQILGLGAFTSVVGDSGLTIAQALDIPVTTGDSYTVSVALRAVRKAAELMGIQMAEATAAVVGATGAIGQVCARFLAEDVARLLLIGRRQAALDVLSGEIRTSSARAQVFACTNVDELKQAQIVLTVTSDLAAVIHSEVLKPGCVVCDVARPRDVSAQVVASRADVLVIDGGMVEVPGQVDFHFDFGLPTGKAYACMAETMALALEGRLENYTLGKKITKEQVEEIDRIATRHGFQLSGLRSFERAITPEQIERIRMSARSHF